MEALNIRTVAAHVGVSVGAIYNYVGNKQTLLEAVLERALRPVTRSAPSSGDWRADLEVTVLGLYRAFSAHPGVITLLEEGVGAERMDPIRERLLGSLAEAGLSPHDRVRGQNLLVAFVIGDVIVHHSHTRDYRVAELQRRMSLPRERFPHVAELTRSVADEPGEETFMLGLQGLLATIDSLRPARASHPE